MQSSLITVLLFATAFITQPAGAITTTNAVPATQKETPMSVNITIDTSLGTLKAELFQDKAPLTVANFLAYVDEGYFNGTIFHRVIPNFMIQGGGFTPDMRQKATKANVKNEAANGLKNDRGTLAMARTQIVDSATSQFFINLKANDFLNYKNATAQGFGYCVFGKVTEGLDVLDKIAAVPTGNHPAGHGDVPKETVTIISITRDAK